jgi:hypothetical protein
VYFSLAALCCNKDIGVLYNIIQREFSYEVTRLSRKLPVFDHDAQDVKYIELVADSDKKAFSFELSCAKVDRNEYIDIVKRLRAADKNCTIDDYPFLTLLKDGKMVVSKDLDDFAYDQHFKNIHADNDLIEEARIFRETTTETIHATLDSIAGFDITDDFTVDSVRDTRAENSMISMFLRDESCSHI